MNQDYTDIIQQVSQVLLQAIKERELNLAQNVEKLDSELAKLLRLIGLQVISMLLNGLAQQVTQEAKKPGLVVHRRSAVKYSVIFGTVEVYSPYLWHKKQGWGVRPVQEKLGIEHGEHSLAVKRALTDFGSEESFGQASLRFEEHYGWKVERSAVRREVENIALLALAYVERRLLVLETNFKNQEPPKKRCGWNRVLVELDGSHIRTGILTPAETEELTPQRRIRRCKRQTDWREVRVGFASPVEQKEKRTFVARMGQYPEVVQQLKSAAVDQGLSTYTLVYGLADGGNGLRESLESEFSHFQFILDRPHLKQHLYATVEAMELTGKIRFIWLKHTLNLIDKGQVNKVISRLKRWQGKGQQRVLNLAKYLERFRDALHYEKYRSLGLPIGSGEIESAHRYIPQKRLKLPGATWHPLTINPMLALRVIRANDWWNDFWYQLSLDKNQLISCC
jgi:hypothetical protein